VIARNAKNTVKRISACILALGSTAIMLALVGCGNGAGTANVQNPPPPASTPVTVAFQPNPSGNITLNSVTSVTAVVSNDPTNSGVDWAVVCSSPGNCGSISPLHTASGSAAVYTAPSSSSGNSETITVEAFATANHSDNTVATLSIVGFSNSLQGTYVFQTKGVDVNGGPFQLAGVATLNGGTITGGEQTHSDFVATYSDTIAGGSYTIGPDGRGTMTINTANPNIGQGGIENFAIVYLSPSEAFLVTLDDFNLAPSSETSSGSMNLQTSTDAPTGGYAFAVNGTDLSLDPLAMGGVINIDSPNTISGKGSIADQDLAGTLTPKTTLSGTTTAPDSFGAMEFDLTAPFGIMKFTGYIIDSTHVALIETDIDGLGNGTGATGGTAISQGTAAGTFTKSSFTGPYVFGILGQDLTGFPVSLASTGYLTADGNGKVTSGYNDEYLSGFGVYISDSISGTYSVDSTKIGRADAKLTFATNGPGPEFIFYLTGTGNPPLVLDADANIGSLGMGIAYPQAAAPIPFNGTYGMYFTQGAFGLEIDSTAQITVDGAAQTFDGTVDTNFLLSPLPDTELSGTFATISTNGRADGTMTNTYFPSPGSTPSTIGVAYYLIDAGHGFVIETDSLTSGQLMFGYFSQQTPVCSGCQQAAPKNHGSHQNWGGLGRRQSKVKLPRVRN
jgi:hypothetical protein